MKIKIIGIGGTNGSGKDTLSRILADDYGWLFVSASVDLIIPELARRGLPAERVNMAALSAEWNRLSRGAIIDKAVELYEQKSGQEKYNGLVISSIRHPWEVDKIHALGGQVVWVDADPAVRYQRVMSRGQGDKDKKSFEQFLAEEQTERQHAGDEATLNWQGVKDRADIFITNDSNDLEDFSKAAKTALGL
ncbi:MAG TPA: AAA family ATPase [Candidatus Saccharimonadales bacterium]|nr:AAA family ATPase [Candidatus Saccharimonadales bacterium]